VDEYGTQIFLPLELHKSLKLIQFENHPLCKESKTILEFKKETPSSWWDNFYNYAVLLAFIVLINKKNIDIFYLFIMGFLGLFFAFMGFYSFHEELAYNYNILLFNPLLLVLLYFYYTKNNKWIINLSLANLFFLFIYVLFMLNKTHILIVLPLVLTSTVLLIKTIIRESKRIPVVI
jgi:peptidoglycan/LPS O-acetylase OafA/YrhL